MAKGPSARRLAARILQDVERSSGFSNRALSRQLERHPGMDVRDRGLTTTLVYGVLRHRARLDAHIDTHAKRPKGIKGETRQVLRIAVFEMLELQRPPAIAVSEALRSLERAGPLRGAVQAILGAVGREGAALEERCHAGELLGTLSFAAAHALRLPRRGSLRPRSLADFTVLPGAVVDAGAVVPPSLTFLNGRIAVDTLEPAREVAPRGLWTFAS